MQQNETEKLSRFNIGIQAFQKILDLLGRVTIIGHKARKRYKNKTIIEYLGILETLYITVSPVLLKTDKDFIETEIKSLKTPISLYYGTVKGDKIKLVERLTNLEQRFYNAIQDIDMYIVLKHDYTRASKKMQFKEHIEGTDIPDFDDDEEDY